MNIIMVSVIICTYNRCESLRQTLRSLARMDIPPGLRWELLIVDNNSTDGTRLIVEEFVRGSGLPIRHLSETNQGHSHARNRGLREAQGDIIIFTDDDVTVDANWLGQIRKAFAEFGAAGVGGKIVPVWTLPKPAWLQEEGPYALVKVIVSLDLGDEPREIKTPPFGANMAFTKSVFTKYGFFRTDLGRSKDVLLGGEDTEFFSRLMKGGEKIIYTPSAVVYHPVTEDRITKGYFLKWYLNGGKTLARLDELSNGTVRYFGIPRYLFRSLGESLVKWFLALDPNRRFYHKLHVYRHVGQLTESFRLRHEKSAPGPTVAKTTA